MNWTTVFLIAVVLIAADKVITVMNIKAVQRHSPEIENAYEIEKNPIAKMFFEKTGLFIGSILYGIFSLATFFFAMLLFYYPAKIFAPNNAWGVSLYVVFIIYSFVIGNNAYFFFKYSKLL